MVELVTETPAHLVAFRGRGQIAKDDIDRVAARFEQALRRHEQISFFADAAAVDGFAGDVFVKGMLYDLRQTKHLRRIHRVALVVEEDSWAHRVADWGDRLVPGIEVRLFGSAEREAAVAWAGAAPPEAGPPKRGLEAITTEDPRTLAFAVAGPVTGADVEAIAPKLKAAFDQHGTANLLMRLSDGYRFRMDVFSKQLAEMKTDALGHLDRYAVVGAPTWMQSAGGFFAPLVDLDVRFFDAEDEDEAWAWLGTRPADPEQLTAGAPPA